MPRIVLEELFTFRFKARFYRGPDLVGSPGDHELEVGFSSIRHTVNGLEFRRGHRVDQPLLMSTIGEMSGVDIIMIARPPHRPSRTISYLIGDPLSLPIWLDAADNAPAYDCVLFRKAVVLGVKDAVIDEKF